MAADPASEQIEVSAEVLLEVLAGLATELHPGHGAAARPRLDSSLDRDLGLDSLGRVELVLRLERRFGVALPEQLALEAETPEDLLTALRRSLGQKDPGLAPRPRTTSPTAAESTARPAPAQIETLVELLEWHFDQHPGHTHIRFYSDTDDGATISHAQLHDQARRIGAGLQARGIGVGDTVALMLPTDTDYFVSFFGILLAGAIPVPIYPPVRPSQLEDHLRRQTAILRNCEARALITVSAARKVAQLLRTQVDSLRLVTTVGELGAGDALLQRPALKGDDIAFLQYTSGSTGNPKGVVLSHANLLANIRVDGRGLEVRSGDVFVSWLPLYHDMGLIGAWLGSLYHAVPLVVMSPLAFLSRPKRWLWAMHKHGGTLSAAPNFAYELCLKRIRDEELEGLDLSTWRLALNGAEAISPETLRRFQSRFAAYGLRQDALLPVYGLAECAVGLCFPPLGRGPQIDRIDRDRLARDGQAPPAGDSTRNVREVVCCGRPLPGHEIRVVDGSGHELPERQQGRLQFRGPSATRGYYRNPEQTAALFQDGWLETGDLAYLAAGEVYLTGRSKDLIIRAGRNIHPDELEAAIGELEGVRKGRVAVFGSMDPESGTERLVVLAETRLKDESERSRLREEINALASDLIAAPPDDIVLAPDNSVLKTSSGKIRRAASREAYEQGRIGQRPSPIWLQLLRFGLSGARSGLRQAWRGLSARLYAAYCWLAVASISTPVVLVLLAAPGRSWRWPLIRAALRALAWLTGTGLRVQGQENLPSGPCVLTANHASYLDVFVLIAALPRAVSFVAKAELRNNPVARRVLQSLHTCFVDRGDREQGLASAREMTGLAAAGRALMFFPEATFRRMPGLLPFRMGAFTTAVTAGVPVVPIAIRGTRAILRDDTWFPRHGRVEILIGEPLYAAAPEPWQAALDLRQAARAYILAHCGEPDLAADSGAFDRNF